jgi:Na+/pantothenate symporter
MNTWDSFVAGGGRVPSNVWVLLGLVNLLVTVLTWSTARRRMRRAGARTADSGLVSGGLARRRDTALTVAAMVPAALFWAMVLAGSFHGLVSFGRTVLGWHAGWEYLIPGTLDGVSVTFAFLAFRAVRMKKAPDRCYRVVWGAAIASATVNFAYEYTHSDHNIIVGGYLARC